MSKLVLALCASALLVASCVAEEDWEATYGAHRHREATSFKDWLRHIPRPHTSKLFESDLWNNANNTERDGWHRECLQKQAQELIKHVKTYRSPILSEVRKEVDILLEKQQKKVALAIFWGRGRYVRLLWPYIERNLRANMGILDEVILITNNRDSDEGAAEARAIMEAGIEKYPGVVREVPFCPKPYGCAFDYILTDNSTVYLKVDDDIIFIKDGSFEHLVFQQIANPEYAFYSASIVNNPHGYGVHAFAGAMQPSSYSWAAAYQPFSARPPFIVKDAYDYYYGKNVYNSVGSRTHEAFVYNVANNRLDMYTFDLWNMQRCKCGKKQLGLEMCHNGFYRWSINGFVFEHRNAEDYPRDTGSFDEPDVGIGWVSHSPQRRVAIVGESLLVHALYTRQRSATPRFGLKEEVLLPWHWELMTQYTAKPWNTWAGNETLQTLWEDLQAEAGNKKWPTLRKR